MDFGSARRAVLQLLGTTAPADVPALLHWMRTTRMQRKNVPVQRPAVLWKEGHLTSEHDKVHVTLTSLPLSPLRSVRLERLGVLSWDFDEFTQDNNDVMLKNIADDLRSCLPPEAVLCSEQLALQKIRQQPEPTVHVDAFLYDEDFIDSLCEEGKMSRNYCTTCGSHQTAPLGFISHSFSLMELKFLYHHVLPDLSGKVLVDIGSRLGTVLYGGYLYSSAAQLYGVELNGEFCQLQEMIIKKYEFGDRIKVLHADVCTQGPLLQSADVIVMNNVFEYFLTEAEQASEVLSLSKTVKKIKISCRFYPRTCRVCATIILPIRTVAWDYIIHNVRKQGSLLVTVPSLQESLLGLKKTDVQLSCWVEEIPLNLDVCQQSETDREALEQIHLYRVL